MNGDLLLPEDKKDLTEVQGTVDEVVFKNDTTGYAVCTLECEDGSIVTLVGIMPFLGEGEGIKALGKWELHPNFGRQFKVEFYEKELPEDENSILKYLSSGAVKGIGPVLAKRIVEKYGTDSFDVIENRPDWLADIEGITLKKARKLSERFRETFGIRTVMMFCRDFFGTATAMKVYKQWGCAAVDVIRENPYVLCEKINGVGFETADRIAEQLGIDRSSGNRVQAGVVYTLSFNAAQNGHTFIPRDKLEPSVGQLLAVDRDSVRDGVEALIGSGRIVSVKYNGREVIYLKEYFEAERYSAAKLEQLQKTCDRVSMGEAERFLRLLEVELDITYAALQRKAIMDSLNSGVMVLTGGPGTGKTTVIKAVILLLERMGMKIALAAPTGRAAKRMSEATSREAKTIHRLLETNYSGDNGKPVFCRDENDTLDEDVIIIDEASMVDTLLLSSLLKAIKPGARLLLIGDSDQLPSVGAGYVLNDIIESGRFPSVRLTEIFRQAQESLIVTNAHAVIHGNMPDLTVKNSDFFFLSRREERSIAPTVIDLVACRLPKTYGEEAARGIQVITPSHKGAAGTDCLNAGLQAALNPPSPKKKEHKVRETVLREGDKVMQIKNNYDIGWEKDGKEGVGVFNGDIGIIRKIDTAGETVTVDYDGKLAAYDFTQLDELEHAYAITVHKSQGSEYPIVIIPAYGACYSRLLSRNLLYTAITRAKDMVIIVGSADVVRLMVENNAEVRRYTGLSYLLRSYEEA